jgi:hypothetical protein
MRQTQNNYLNMAGAVMYNIFQRLPYPRFERTARGANKRGGGGMRYG